MSTKEVQHESYDLLETDDLKGTRHYDRSNTEQSTLDWRCEPSSLEDNRLDRFIFALWDVLLVAIPIALIIKIGLCIYCYHRDEDHRGTTIDMTSGMTKVLIDINEQMVTLFTVIFAAIMATLVRRYALYKAERGAYLSELEQLQGSISVTGTLKMIWSLRAWKLTSVILCIVWAFYYLGSQAAKREFVLADSADYKNIPALVASFNGPSGFASINPNPAGIPTVDDAAFVETVVPVINSVFASLTKDSLDNWRNQLINYFSPNRGSLYGPLIPNLEYALDPFPLKSKQVDTMFQNIMPLEDPKALGRSSKGGWVDVSRQSGNLYTAIFGRPLVIHDPSNPDHRNQTVTAVDGYYTSHSAYFTIGCNEPELLPLSDFPNGTHPESSISFNITTPSSSSKDSQGHELQQFEFWYRWSQDPSLSCVAANSLRSICNVSTIQIDIEASCKSLGCFPRHIRYRDNQHAENATSFSTAFDNTQFSQNFFSYLIDSTGQQASFSSPTDFIRYSGILYVDPGNFAQQPSDNSSCVLDTQSWQVSLSDVARYHLSPQLTALFNTYYNVFQTYISYEYSNVTAFNETYKSDGRSDAVMFYGNFDDQGYYIHWEWIAIDFISCLLLLAAGVACCWLRLNTLAPDIFGFVSSLTRDNPHLGLPASGSSLSGLERARLLRDIKLRIGDLHVDEGHANAAATSGSEVGRIGLVRVDTDGHRARTLQKGKHYI